MSNTVGNTPETSVTFSIVDPESADAVRSMTSYFKELDNRFESGFYDGDIVLSGAERFRPPAGQFLLGSQAGEIISCGGVQRLESAVVEIKRMWVAPHARGKGVGAQTLRRLETAAVELGGTRVFLDTNSVLHEAIALYTSRGYTAIDRYNDNPYAQRWYAKTLGP